MNTEGPKSAIKQQGIWDILLNRIVEIRSASTRTRSNAAELENKIFGPAPEACNVDDKSELCSIMDKLNYELDFITHNLSEINHSINITKIMN